MNSLFENYSFDWIRQATHNVWSLISGIFFSAIGYFVPIKNIVHLVLFFFLMDVIFGYWAARKLRKEKFSTKIVWQYTMPRILLSLVMILSAYMWDTVFNQEFIATYKVLGWFICGILIYSIGKNGYKITHWEMFPLVGKLFEKRIEKETGIDLSEEGNL